VLRHNTEAYSVGLFSLGFRNWGNFNLKCHTFAAFLERNPQWGEFDQSSVPQSPAKSPQLSLADLSPEELVGWLRWRIRMCYWKQWRERLLTRVRFKRLLDCFFISLYTSSPILLLRKASPVQIWLHRHTCCNTVKTLGKP
jgi:hypothetical protein